MPNVINTPIDAGVTNEWPNLIPEAGSNRVHLIFVYLEMVNSGDAADDMAGTYTYNGVSYALVGEAVGENASLRGVSIFAAKETSIAAAEAGSGGVTCVSKDTLTNCVSAGGYSAVSVTAQNVDQSVDLTTLTYSAGLFDTRVSGQEFPHGIDVPALPDDLVLVGAILTQPDTTTWTDATGLVDEIHGSERTITLAAVTAVADATIAPAVSADTGDSYATVLAAIRLPAIAAPANQAPVADDATFNIFDNAQNGDVVGTAPATDSDGTVVSATITGTAFAIDNARQITVADASQLIAGNSIVETVTVTDDDGDTDTSTITINVSAAELSITSASDDTPQPLDQITLFFENELAAVTAGDFNIASQASGQATIDIPDPTTFILSGQTYPTLTFLTNTAIPLSDGTNSDTYDIQIQLPDNTLYAEVEVIDPDGIYANDGAAPGMFGYAYDIVGDWVIDLTTGLTSAPEAGGSFSYKIYNGEWGTAGTVTAAAKPQSTVSIDSITPSKTSAVVEFSYSGSDVTSFEYNIGAGWVTATSPATITGLTEETTYTINIRPVNDGAVGDGTQDSFTTDEAVDDTPNVMTFTAATNQARSVYVTSNTVTVQGVDPGVDIPLTITNGEHSYSTDGGQNWSTFATGNINVRLNYQIRVRHLTSAAYNTSVTTTLNVGGQVPTFTSTTLADTVAPVITLTGGNISIVEGNAWVEPGYSAIDNADGDISVGGVVITGSVDTNTVGTYTLTYTATDAAGNSASTTRTVTVTEYIPGDTQPPTISLVGGNITIEEGETWTEPGYSAVDNEDGPVAVTVSGTVNTNVPATYTLTYTASDSSGNTASVSRTVIVQPEIVYPTSSAAPDTRTYLASRVNRVEKGEAVFIKQADEILDYDFDLTGWLTEQGDTLPDGNFSLATSDPDLEVVGAGIISGTNRVKVWLSGGKSESYGTSYAVELTIITASFRKAQFLIRLVVIDRLQ